MGLHIALHNPDRADVFEFESEGKYQACVRISRADYTPIAIYTTPEKARAIAAIINGTVVSAEGVPV